jgi:hypothetical protein
MDALFSEAQVSLGRQVLAGDIWGSQNPDGLEGNRLGCQFHNLE